MLVEYYQTEGGDETIAIIKDEDGFASFGIARAGRMDKILGAVTEERGREIALGRAIKARTLKVPIIERNYLRGFYGKRVD